MSSPIDHATSNVLPVTDEFLSRAEVAHLFNVSPSTVTRWAEAGKLNCMKTLGGHRRYETRSVLEQVRGLRQREESRLKCIELTVPQMYGDHHTLIVQQALLRLPGIGNVSISTARRQVQIEFDEEALCEADILAQLESAGYSTGIHKQAIAVGKTRKDPIWALTTLRMTQTNPVSA